MARTITVRDDGWWSVPGTPDDAYYDHVTAMRLAAELDLEDNFPTSPAAELGRYYSNNATLMMCLSLLQGGSILVPNVDVAIGVPASPAGIQRRAVYMLPLATSSARTITLLGANAQVGSLICLVMAGRLSMGGSYRIVTEVDDADPLELLTGAEFAAMITAPVGEPFVQMYQATYDGTEWTGFNGSGAVGERVFDIGITAGI